jgi:alanyl-tRNA synthetase
MLLLRKMERRRDSWRVEFVCGFRALATARADFAALTQSASLMSCGLPEVPDGIRKMIEDRRSLHSATKKLDERLADLEARALIVQGTRQTDGRVIVSALIEGATQTYLALLAAKVVSEANAMVMLGTSSGHVVFAQTKGGASDMGGLLRETLKEFGGKGGGARDFAQGSVAPGANLASLLDSAKAKLKT